MEVQTELMLAAADNIDPQNTLGDARTFRSRRERMRQYPRGFAPPIPGSAAEMKSHLLDTETLSAHMKSDQTINLGRTSQVDRNLDFVST